MALATEALASYELLATLPCYRWTHNLVMLPGHPLLALTEPVSLHELVKYPLITYEFGYTGRAHIDDAFVAAGLQCDVVMTAMDADVIKTYVELEMGVGIVASMASDPRARLAPAHARREAPVWRQCHAAWAAQKAVAAQVRLWVYRDVCAHTHRRGDSPGA